MLWLRALPGACSWGGLLVGLGQVCLRSRCAVPAGLHLRAAPCLVPLWVVLPPALRRGWRRVSLAFSLWLGALRSVVSGLPGVAVNTGLSRRNAWGAGQARYSWGGPGPVSGSLSSARCHAPPLLSKDSLGGGEQKKAGSYSSIPIYICWRFSAAPPPLPCVFSYAVV